MRLLIKLLIKTYQLLVSPLLPSSCRFHPSCSEYTLQAIKNHGVFRGLWLSCCRLLRCHPWGNSGYDPVPNKEKH
ncbi:MAG: membrane protein insertion efficiency factor YidD [Legionellales bacterium RIFCSPHIGHO2_12_FULL_35_11]|nr:MAG: membrane protein insertion efficiency factor YidD [Legionellales bacterium RIFCSPHIGHO2_12_FULL_35_11]